MMSTGVLGTVAGCLTHSSDDSGNSSPPGLPSEDSDSDNEKDIYEPFGTDVATFETVNQWSTHGNVSIEKYYESGAIARISGNPGSIEMTMDPNYDLSMRDISIVARIDQPQRTNLRMRLTDTDGETLSLVSEYHRDLHPTGWLTFTLSVAEAEADLSSIENILISLDGGDEAPLYWLDELRFPQRTSNTAQFSFTFDDNTRDVYETFYPIMREFGFSGSAAIITDQIGEPGRLTLTEIDKLAEAG